MHALSGSDFFLKSKNRISSLLVLTLFLEVINEIELTQEEEEEMTFHIKVINNKINYSK
jgi:hypothetical protein